MYKMKTQKGITLIALIITIVVLLILAVVAINSITNDGIISKAEQAANKYNESVQNEADILQGYLDYLNNQKIETVASAKASGKTYTVNTTLKDDNGNLVKVPAGFKIASDSATSVTGGVVIEDATYEGTIGSQFVWIPTGAVKTEADTKTITLARYVFDITVDLDTGELGGTGAISQTITSAEAELTDPYITAVFEAEGLEDIYYKEGKIEGIDDQGKGYALNVSDFLNSAKPLAQGGNGGYYIGRYEARKNSTTSKLTTVGTDTVYTNITQPNATSESQGMYATNNNFTSDLVNSFAWDTAITFIQAFGGEGFSDYSIHTSKNTGSKATTGTNNLTDTTKQDVVCNIWDMASNCSEWSTETFSYADWPCVCRGGIYNSSGYASFRSYDLSTTDSCDFGSFRPLLYVGL